MSRAILRSTRKCGILGVQLNSARSRQLSRNLQRSITGRHPIEIASKLGSGQRTRTPYGHHAGKGLGAVQLPTQPNQP